MSTCVHVHIVLCALAVATLNSTQLFSFLCTVPNVGPKKARLLLDAFKSLNALSRASASEISANVPSIGRDVAKELCDVLQGRTAR